MTAQRLHRFLVREDDASRPAGLLASATPTPSRSRSGYSVEVSMGRYSSTPAPDSHRVPVRRAIDIQLGIHGNRPRPVFDFRILLALPLSLKW
jgi:hypothetical protein